MKTALFTCVMAFLLLSTQTQGQFSVNITSCMDNTIYAESNDLSNGKGEYLIVGKSDATYGNALRRAMIRFDFSLIPSNATITNVEIRIFGNSGSPTSVQMHRVLTEWGEGNSKATGDEFGGATATAQDATWKYSKYNTDQWTSLGADFNISPSATAIVAAGVQSVFSSTALIAEVQSMISGGSNFGWVLRGNETNNASAISLKSSDIANGIPYINVQYNLPPRQVFFNELVPNAQWVEIYNPGPGAVDISDWYLCNGVDREQIGSSAAINVLSGSTNVAADGFVQIMWNKISSAIGELALFKSTAFGFYGVLEDYVQYGAGSNDKAGIAVLAGVWDSQTNYVPTPTTGSGIGLMSMGYTSGEDTKSTDWAEQNPTPGAKNICDISLKLLGDINAGNYEATDIIVAGTIKTGLPVNLLYGNTVEFATNSEVENSTTLQVVKIICPN